MVLCTIGMALIGLGSTMGVHRIPNRSWVHHGYEVPHRYGLFHGLEVLHGYGWGPPWVWSPPWIVNCRPVASSPVKRYNIILFRWHPRPLHRGQHHEPSRNCILDVQSTVIANSFYVKLFHGLNISSGCAKDSRHPGVLTKRLSSLN